ncbi:MAG: EAL domain-containing protein, partial [Treponema sp.]|nr:EAL domain-containing protein [Treponema sp.]
MKKDNSRFENVEYMPGGVIVYKADETRDVIYANKKALNLFGCKDIESFKKLRGENFENILYSEDVKLADETIRHNLSKNIRTFDHVIFRIKNKDNSFSYVEDFWEVVDDEELGELYYIFITLPNSRITDSYIDNLTGLYTRNHFFNILEKKRRFAIKKNINGKKYLLAFNIARFKLFNSAFGPKTGDECIKKIGIILKEEFGQENVSRFSGDRFIALYEDENVIEKIEKIHEKVLHLYDTYKLWITAGIYEWRKDEKANLACELSMLACDTVKQSSISYYEIYTEKLRNELELKQYVQNNIDKATRNKYIEIYYQPIIRSLTGRLCEIEALTRWNDPNHGFMPPDIFIPALEESGLCYKLDIYVIEQIAKSLRQRINKGLPVTPVSVNISLTDFEVCDIFKIIDEIM